MKKHIMQNESSAEIALFRSAYSNIYRTPNPAKKAFRVKCTWASPEKLGVEEENGSKF